MNLILYCDVPGVSTLGGRCGTYSVQIMYYNNSLLLSLMWQEKPEYFPFSTQN